MYQSISLSGTKEQAKLQLDAALPPDSKLHIALTAIIDGAPGTVVSISGGFNTAEDLKSGSLSMSASFWTPGGPL